MTFQKGQSGNPNGRPVHRTQDGKTVTQLARDLTQDAIDTLAEIMRDRAAPSAARVSASTQILNRGWGQAPQTITINETAATPDLSQMNTEQLEALETLRSLAPLADGTAGSC